jgi:hypothetical protein
VQNEELFRELVSEVVSGESGAGDTPEAGEVGAEPTHLASAHFIHIARTLLEQNPLETGEVHPALLNTARLSLPLGAESEDARRLVAVGYGLGYAACLALLYPKAVFEPLHAVAMGLMAGSAAYQTIAVVEAEAEGADRADGPAADG